MKKFFVLTLIAISVVLVGCGENSTATSTSTPAIQTTQPTATPTHALKWTVTHMTWSFNPHPIFGSDATLEKRA